MLLGMDIELGRTSRLKDLKLIFFQPFVLFDLLIILQFQELENFENILPFFINLILPIGKNLSKTHQFIIQ